MCNREQWYPQMWHGIIPPYANDGSYRITVSSSSATVYEPADYPGSITMKKND